MVSLLVLFILFFAPTTWAQPSSVLYSDWIITPANEEERQSGWETNYYFRNRFRVYWLSIGKTGNQTKLAINVTDIPAQRFSHLYAEASRIISISGSQYLLVEVGSTSVACGLPTSIREMLEIILTGRECPSA